jgi:hypothetical protein
MDFFDRVAKAATEFDIDKLAQFTAAVEEFPSAPTAQSLVSDAGSKIVVTSAGEPRFRQCGSGRLRVQGLDC